MNEKYTIALIAITLAGCTTTNKEEITQPIAKNEIHFISNHGTKNIPVSVISDGDQIHLFYTTGSEEWGHAVSTNLLHWSMIGSVEVPSEEMGDIVLRNTEWFSVFKGEDEIQAYTSKDLKSWTEVDLKIAENANGIPKINNADQDWVMTITNEDSIAFYKSSNLEEWIFVNKVSNGYNSEYSELITLENSLFLAANGGNTHFKINIDKNHYQIIGTATTYPNNAKGTFFRRNKTDYAILAFNEKIFSIPLEVTYFREKMLLSPSKQILNSQMVDRKRGRLEFLLGGYPCVFSFSLDSTVKQADILLTNKFEQEAILKLKDLNSASSELKLDGLLESYSCAFKKERGGPIDLDIIIDYGSVEFFINNGEVHLIAALNTRNILDRIFITVDGKKLSPPASLIRINERAATDQ